MLAHARTVARSANALRVSLGQHHLDHWHRNWSSETSGGPVRSLFRRSDLAVGETDKIFLKGLKFHGYHGVLPEENVLGQKFVIDLTMSVDLRKAGETDDLNHTVNYAEVFRQVKTVVEGPPQQLIETVAAKIAKDVLDSHEAVRDIMVRVQKPHVALEGVLDTLGIEIWRQRE